MREPARWIGTSNVPATSTAPRPASVVRPVPERLPASRVGVSVVIVQVNAPWYVLLVVAEDDAREGAALALGVVLGLEQDDRELARGVLLAAVGRTFVSGAQGPARAAPCQGGWSRVP